eukprot:Nk52_evm8s2085 gene=Nk52_evmTU8s2085
MSFVNGTGGFPAAAGVGDFNADPSSKVELSFKCTGLRDMDILSKSDPQVYVFAQDPSNRKWHQIGKTEMIKNNLNPVFTEHVCVDYCFERVQKMMFKVIDVDDQSQVLERQDLIGDFTCTLGQIMGSRGGTIRGELVDGKGRKGGVVHVSAEEVQDMKAVLHLQFTGIGLTKKDFFGKSDPFLRISRMRSDGSFQAVHKTEVIMSNLNPVWKQFSIPLQRLCNGDREKQLLFEVYDFNKSGKEDFIGSFRCNVFDLISNFEAKRDFALVNEKKKAKKKKYTNDGVLRVTYFVEEQVPSFLDFIAGGCEINLIAAIDFTASNGDPNKPNSLHYSRGGVNQYHAALQAVTDVLNSYNHSGNIKAYGFGANMPQHFLGGGVSHCFPLTGDPNNHDVVGVQGLIEAYHRVLNTVQLYGPTNFAEILRMASYYASPQSCTQDRQQYTILLILTDGVITDMDMTMKAIVEASQLPLSIVIVGVGNADFTNMDILDGDEQRLRYNGVFASRDIVQFVPFRDYAGAHKSRIAEVTLQEIPEQLTSFMKLRQIRPNNRMSAPEGGAGAFVPRRQETQLSFSGSLPPQGQMPGGYGSYGSMQGVNYGTAPPPPNYPPSYNPQGYNQNNGYNPGGY